MFIAFLTFQVHIPKHKGGGDTCSENIHSTSLCTYQVFWDSFSAIALNFEPLLNHILYVYTVLTDLATTKPRSSITWTSPALLTGSATTLTTCMASI
jgi:hypothetical protein